MSDHGDAHRCVCGAFWYDSDGGPCHSECVDCGAVIGEDDDYERCDACLKKYEEQEAENG